MHGEERDLTALTQASLAPRSFGPCWIHPALLVLTLLLRILKPPLLPSCCCYRLGYSVVRTRQLRLAVGSCCHPPALLAPASPPPSPRAAASSAAWALAQHILTPATETDGRKARGWGRPRNWRKTESGGEGASIIAKSFSTSALRFSTISVGVCPGGHSSAALPYLFVEFQAF